MQLTGIHHLTAVSAAIRENHRFYTGTMGMRLVKRSVNQDDTSAYHLFYADAAGSPGTDLTFFDGSVPRERRGTRSVVETGLRVGSDASLAWWRTHLAARGITHGDIEERDGRATLALEDGEGMRLRLVNDGGLGDAPVVWDASPVPAEHQIRGLGPIVMSVPELTRTDVVLQKVMGLRPVREYAMPRSDAGSASDAVHVYEMEAPGSTTGPHAELHVAVQPGLAVTQPGAGGVHHVAFRSPDADYAAWAEHLATIGMPNSGPVDRFWFRSLYFREPNGVLFEIATDGPGFAVDESAETLGEKVVLPPFLERDRARILAGLKPID